MDKFDVHRTTGSNTAGTPYIVVVQATRYGGRGRCVVVLPHANDGDPNLTPVFQIEGREVFLDALRIMNADATVLGRHMAPLAR